MTVHFAAARSVSHSPVARAFARRAIARAANDNGDLALQQHQDSVLRAALLHFAKHGLAGPSEARKEAEQAFFAGDSDAYKWWLDICRTLDRRMAEEVTRKRQS